MGDGMAFENLVVIQQLRQVKRPGNVITQNQRVEHALLRVRQLRRELAEAIECRNQKGNEIRIKYVALRAQIEPGVHKVWLSVRNNLVVA
jgi:hypothetical protein